MFRFSLQLAVAVLGVLATATAQELGTHGGHLRGDLRKLQPDTPCDGLADAACMQTTCKTCTRKGCYGDTPNQKCFRRWACDKVKELCLAKKNTVETATKKIDFCGKCQTCGNKTSFKCNKACKICNIANGGPKPATQNGNEEPKEPQEMKARNKMGGCFKCKKCQMRNGMGAEKCSEICLESNCPNDVCVACKTCTDNGMASKSFCKKACESCDEEATPGEMQTEAKEAPAKESEEAPEEESEEAPEEESEEAPEEESEEAPEEESEEAPEEGDEDESEGQESKDICRECKLCQKKNYMGALACFEICVESKCPNIKAIDVCDKCKECKKRGNSGMLCEHACKSCGREATPPEPCEYCGKCQADGLTTDPCERACFVCEDTAGELPKPVPPLLNPEEENPEDGMKKFQNWKPGEYNEMNFGQYQGNMAEFVSGDKDEHKDGEFKDKMKKFMTSSAKEYGNANKQDDKPKFLVDRKPHDMKPHGH